MAGDLYLGYRNDDSSTPFGKFFKPEIAPLAKHVVEALQHGPQAGPALLAFDDAASVADEGYQPTENGYGVLDDGSVQVSVRTDMPGVTPQMWSWWFGWHGSDQRRPVASKVIGVSEATARNLLVHCAQETNHLAGFLPELWEGLAHE